MEAVGAEMSEEEKINIWYLSILDSNSGSYVASPIDCPLVPTIKVVEYSALEAARQENEEMMFDNYWADRCKIAQAQADKLAEALESIAAYHSHEPIIDEVFDVARQALKEYRGEK